MEGDATCRHEPCHIRCLGVAVETRRKAGYCECAFRSASAARALARRQLVTIQSTQARARRAAKRSGLLRAGVWPCPRKRHRMVRVFEAHENFRRCRCSENRCCAVAATSSALAAASRAVICDPLFPVLGAAFGRSIFSILFAAVIRSRSEPLPEIVGTLLVDFALFFGRFFTADLFVVRLFAGCGFTPFGSAAGLSG